MTRVARVGLLAAGLLLGLIIGLLGMPEIGAIVAVAAAGVVAAVVESRRGPPAE